MPKQAEFTDGLLWTENNGSWGGGTGASGRVGHLGLSRVMGAHGGPHAVITVAEGRGQLIQTCEYWISTLFQKFTGESPSLEDSQVARCT